MPPLLKRHLYGISALLGLISCAIIIGLHHGIWVGVGAVILFPITIPIGPLYVLFAFHNWIPFHIVYGAGLIIFLSGLVHWKRK